MTFSSVMLLIIFLGLMFLMHRSGGSGGCCGGHQHGDQDNTNTSHNHDSHGSECHSRPAKQNDDQRDIDMARDPVCNMWVRRSEAIRREIRGESVFFCSEACAEEFMAKSA